MQGNPRTSHPAPPTVTGTTQADATVLRRAAFVIQSRRVPDDPWDADDLISRLLDLASELDPIPGTPAAAPGSGTQYTRVYRRGATAAHLVLAGANSLVCDLAGQHVDSETWRGTGSQAEYDRAAALPLCGECAAYAARNGVTA